MTNREIFDILQRLETASSKQSAQLTGLAVKVDALDEKWSVRCALKHKPRPIYKRPDAWAVLAGSLLYLVFSLFGVSPPPTP